MITVAAIVNFVLIVTYKMRPVITSIHGITDRIGLIASASEEVVMASRSLAAGTSEQASAVEETSPELAAKTHAEFSRITEGSKKIGELIGKMAAASQEQAQGIGQTVRLSSNSTRSFNEIPLTPIKPLTQPRR